VSSSSASTNNKKSTKKKEINAVTTPNIGSNTESQGKNKLVQYKVKGNIGLVKGMEDDENPTKLRHPLN
jgi:hypothetical protein